MHSHRWITAVVALPILIVAIAMAGPALLALIIALVVVLALWEYGHIAYYDAPLKPWGLLSLVSYLCGLLMVWAAYRNAPGLMPAVLAADLAAVAFISLGRFHSDPTISVTLARQILGVVYIALPFSLLMLIRLGADGVTWIFWLLAIVFAGDTAAYYTGSYFGKHKLAPHVSPNKTIEGALGGLGANLVVGALIKALFLPLLPWGGCLIFFVAAGIAGQIGDLFESVLKRTADIKDSGRILPGHGGILDRIDALLFAIPVAYFFKLFVF